MAGLAEPRDHCRRRRLDRFQADLEESLAPDGCGRRTGLRLGADVEMAMYEHARGALEHWHVATDRATEGQ